MSAPKLSCVRVQFWHDLLNKIRCLKWRLILCDVTRMRLSHGVWLPAAGLVYWSDGAEVGFYLNQFTSREEVIINLYRTPFLGGRTHTSSALTLLRETVFTSSRGDRDTVRVASRRTPRGGSSRSRGGRIEGRGGYKRVGPRGSGHRGRRVLRACGPGLIQSPSVFCVCSAA